MSAPRHGLLARSLAACLGLACTLPALAQEVASGVPDSLLPYYDALLEEGEWGAVLNLQRLGLEAIDQRRPDIAARAFDAAIERIELVYANSDSAKKARSLWSSEGVKDYKGEPYERAMAYYYRGLLFLAEGDHENARASFRSAEYQDTISNDETYAGDFGMMSLLAGWASSCAGDPAMAEDFYQRAATQQPEGLQPPPAGSGTLLLVESGTSPVKIATGPYGEALKFQAGDNPFASVTAGGQALPVLGDLGWQANTLGGRQIDVVLNGKASFRQGSETVAEVGMLGVQAALGSGDSGAAGALALVGVAAILLSSATKAKADIRAWENLPDRIHGGFLPAGAPAPAVAEITADGDAYEVPAPVLDATAGSCRLLVYRTREPGALRAQPVSNLSAAERKSLSRRNQARDARFREEMGARFQADTDSIAGAELP
ncbi:hypothetical protein [Luteimonas sp. SDU101]|uniref:hypothetical protein n=1 Tax=unclassified Luteimonas TaxID=2629088 RepID=UPI003EC0C044